MRVRSGIVSLSLLILCGITAPAGGQTFQTSPFDDPFLDTPVGAEARNAAPRVTFRLLTEIALPGPLPGAGPRIVDDRIEIPVRGGIARTGWTPDAQVELANGAAAAADPLPETQWVEGPRGKFRYTAIPSGWIVSQRRCRRCRDGWRGNWRLRVSGSTIAPPLVTAKRVYFGALDNHVYSVKRRNGHRVWSTNVDQRVSTPLLLWTRSADDEGDPGSGTALDLLLVVPDDSSRIVALDPQGGERTASFQLPDEGDTLIGRPLITPDRRIVIARQRYDRSEASLMVLQIAEPPAASTPPADPAAETATRALPDGPAALRR
jgi:hypothetical protein